MEKLKVFEAFSGVGTQSMALKRAGIPYEVVAIAEINDKAVQSYEAIHGKVNNLGDVSKIKTEDIPNHDLFTYSFPCQDLTKAGRNLGMDENSGTRSSMLWECKKIIETKKPKFLMLENVDNMVSKKHIEGFNKWLDWLESQGYKNHWQILNSKDYGIPQNRKRVFVISFLEDTDFKFPEPVELQYTVLDFLETFETDVEALTPHEQECLVLEVLPDKVKTRANTKKGYEFVEVGDCFNFSYPNSTTKRGRVGKQIAQSLLTACQQAVLLPSLEFKKLSPLEYWRLMGISDQDYYKAVEAGMTKSDLYHQAGNAIVVDVLVAIFKQMFKK